MNTESSPNIPTRDCLMKNNGKNEFLFKKLLVLDIFLRK